MKGQWGLIVGLVVALLITIFAVINMDVVTVNYMLGTAQWPLVIVIISSVLMGAILVGGVGVYQFYKLRSQLKKLQTENDELKRKTMTESPTEKAPELDNPTN
jgi:lipopolysaccharide assembly protein A